MICEVAERREEDRDSIGGLRILLNKGKYLTVSSRCLDSFKFNN